jgi:ubiquinone/menaquinone biosynthesis C-methylase UbiE
MIETGARRRFIEEYRQIRYAEGRGSEDPAYYRALPYEDITGKNSAMWAMRARTWKYFERKLLPSFGCGLDILDLGAGNGWMSYRLSLHDHHAVAVDIFSDPRDGLAAARHYPTAFPAIEADFSRLPFAPASFDLAIFNASLHYSSDYVATLSEVRRCLRPGGSLVILETPVYRRREHGELMAAERHAQFEKQYGFRSDALPSIEFLDLATMRELSRALRLRWKIYKPWYGWKWHIRPWKARLKRTRPPSRFWILVGTFAA